MKCYKHNKNSCCNAAQDAFIQSTMETLLPESCQRSFDELTRYFCIGCNNREPFIVKTINLQVVTNSITKATINETRKYIILCKDFATSLWGGDISKPSKRFDNCGMTSYWKADGSGDVILPSTEFKNATHFFNSVKPPFYGDYEVRIEDEKTMPDCMQDYAFRPFSLLTCLVLSFLYIFY